MDKPKKSEAIGVQEKMIVGVPLSLIPCLNRIAKLEGKNRSQLLRGVLYDYVAGQAKAQGDKALTTQFEAHEKLIDHMLNGEALVPVVEEEETVPVELPVEEKETVEPKGLFSKKKKKQ